MTTLTERAIELAVQRKFDRLDHWLMVGRLTQAEYDGMATEIHQWAETQYASRKVPPIQDSPNWKGPPIIHDKSGSRF